MLCFAFQSRQPAPAGQIIYMAPVGPVTIVADYAKEVDNSASAVTNSTITDNDYDSYRVGAIYNFKGGEVGALLAWNRNATDKATSSWTPSAGPYGYTPPYLQNTYTVLPYFKATIGPVALQGQIQYTFGDGYKWEGTPSSFMSSAGDININALSVFLDATANLNMFYVGGSFAYLSGDDPSKHSTITGGLGVNTGGLDWNPCLIMFNTSTAAYWVGMISGDTGSQVNNEMMNAWFFQGRVGVKPTPQLDVQLAISYAQADTKPTGYVNGTYGTEVDVTGTYKITNNLSYMLGVGYLFTGDYFQGAAPNSTNVDNDYLIINKLTLSF